MRVKGTSSNRSGKSFTEKNVDLISVLGRLKRKQRVGVLETSNKNLIDAISEIAHNTLRGNLKLDPANLRKLAKHKGKLRKVADKRLSWRKKRTFLINQKGSGFFSVLLPIAASLFGSLFSK